MDLRKGVVSQWLPNNPKTALHVLHACDHHKALHCHPTIRDASHIQNKKPFTDPLMVPVEDFVEKWKDSELLSNMKTRHLDTHLPHFKRKARTGPKLSLGVRLHQKSDRQPHGKECQRCTCIGATAACRRTLWAGWLEADAV